jgi:gluconokinase
MAAGTPLTDEDRWPWLESIGDWLAEHESDGCVVTCSALRRVYRDVVRRSAPDACFLYLAGSPELMAQRVGERGHHFMPAELVGSQFDTLEPPADDERAVEIDAALAPDDIVDVFVAAIGADRAGEPT